MFQLKFNSILTEDYNLVKEKRGSYFALYIYRIINIDNLKSYVGRTICLPCNRWLQHFTSKEDDILHEEIQRSNITSFVFKIEQIVLIPNEFKKHPLLERYLSEVELYFIDKFDGFKGYNTKKAWLR